MLSPDECNAKAAELAKQAETAEPRAWRESLLAMAERWLELGHAAEPKMPRKL